MTSEDSLVSLPPRDSLLALRRDIQAEIMAERKKKSQERAFRIQDGELRYFSDLFFTKDSVFDTLSPAQKEELAKIYASFCKRRVTFIPSPYLAFFVGIMYSGIIDPRWFWALVPWSILTFLGLFSWSRWENYLDFLCMRRTIRKADKEKNTLSG